MKLTRVCMCVICTHLQALSSNFFFYKRTMQYQVRRATVKLREEQQNHSAGLT